MTAVIAVLVTVIWFIIKLMVGYIKKELSMLDVTVNKHNVELAKNTEQLKSLFKLISTVTDSNADFNKRLNKVENKVTGIQKTCSIFHKNIN